MHVFPVLDSNYKQRKRNFRCCKSCRQRKIKCDYIETNFKMGCVNCKRSGVVCSLMTANNVMRLSLETTPPKTSLNLFLIPSDARQITREFLQKTFDFRISSPDPDIAYQYLFHDHPRTVIKFRGEDAAMWHESGVVVEDERGSNRFSGREAANNHISSIDHFRFLLSINAFTLNSPDFAFTDDERRQLLRLYFFRFNSIFPVVNEGRFWPEYEKNKALSLVIYAIVLVISRDAQAEPILWQVFARSKKRLQSKYSMRAYHEDFASFIRALEMKIRQIMLVLADLGDHDKLNRLVVLLLLSMHNGAGKLGSEQSSQDLTSALNLAVSLAIHMKFVESRFSFERLLYLTNLWWCCFVFDRFNAVVNSRTLFVRNEDFNVDLPYENKTLLKMVQLARTYEYIATSMYRPFHNSNDDGDDIEDRLDGFDVEAFQNAELDLCAREISAGTLIFNPIKDFSPESQYQYMDNTVLLMTRIINNMSILMSQKIFLDRTLVFGEGPRSRMCQASANILYYLRQMGHQNLLQIPIVMWSLTISMSSYLKIRAGLLLNRSVRVVKPKCPMYELDDFLTEMAIHRQKWWVLDDVLILVNDFLDQLGMAKQRREELGNRSSETTPETPRIAQAQSLAPIKNLLHGTQKPNLVWPEYDQFLDNMFDFDERLFQDMANVVNTMP